MSEWSLKLTPYGQPPIILNLMEESNQPENENIDELSEQRDSIFSDLSYEFDLTGEEIASVKTVHVYINDSFESASYENGHIWFPGQKERDRAIFSDCFGFAKLNLILTKIDGSKQNLVSDYIPILVKRGELNDSVKAMVNYVYNHQDLFQLNGESMPRDLAGLRDSRYRNLTSQIILAEEIATIYEGNYGYFKANSRFRIEKEPTIDYLEHMQYITPTTLQYTATHPEQLKQVYGGEGIHVGNRVYQPQKTRFLKNTLSYDIYENRVILGFLQLMVYSAKDLQEQCEDLLKEIPSDEDYSSEYVYSSFFMFAETRRALEKGVVQLTELSKKFIQLYALYSSALCLDEPPLQTQPKPTSIFMTVPQYNKIFVSIHQWFNAGVYDFEEEKFMLSFVKISSLYEKYLLAKIYEYLVDCGYTLSKSIDCKYPLTTGGKFKNASGHNTFFFTDGQRELTLYYQPVIYNSDKSYVNDIGLYRNNSIPSNVEDDNDYNGGNYYTPDFLIKLKKNDVSKYLIMDAKFSTLNSVRKYQVKELAFKYLFSISTLSPKDSIVGMCLFYGKCDKDEDLSTAYDRELPGNGIVPVADLIPMMEGVANEKQFVNLDRIFRKILY